MRRVGSLPLFTVQGLGFPGVSVRPWTLKLLLHCIGIISLPPCPTSLVFPQTETIEFVRTQLEHSVVGSNELMVAKALRKRQTLLEECDLHFFDILQFQKPLTNASTSEFYF